LDIKNKVDFLLNEFINWCKKQNEIIGVAIVGSFARGDFNADSDVDLVIISTDKMNTIDTIYSQFHYDEMIHHSIEEWGILTSLRIFYKNELEIEYGVVTKQWVEEPLDEGTKEVVENGFMILLDKENIFSSVTKFLHNKY
jgi:predicted nucleotidyltransferase